mgnify:CR=1 FL=1
MTDYIEYFFKIAKATAQEIDEKYKVKEKVKEVKEDVQVIFLLIIPSFFSSKLFFLKYSIF